MTDWSALAERQVYLSAVEYHLTDRPSLWQQFYQWGEPRSLPVYFWNPGCAALCQVVEQNGVFCLQPTSWATNTEDMVQWLLHHSEPGLYLLEGLLETDERGQLGDRRLYQLSNAYHTLQWSGAQYWVLLTEQAELPLSLQPLIPVFVHPLPDRLQIQQTVQRLIQQHPELTTSLMAEDRLVRACQGLPLGEIDLVLRQSLAFVRSVDAWAEHVLHHKTSKLQGRGLELIADPDVANAGGLDLLEARLERISTLFQVEAQTQYNLKFPRGMILWGPPGTGKSLSAKLAAKQMGVPLLAVDWAAVPSDQDLRYLLQTAEAMSPCILYFDDFDKGFAGWDASDDGGRSRRRAGKLLTWMQEHQSQVFIMATVNRLSMMPPELIRRFEEEIYFVDLPNDGARYDVFNLHLAKYFPAFAQTQRTGQSPWSDRQWRQLLVDYRLCTPAEIGNAVRRVAQEAYFRLCQTGRVGEPLEVAFEEMLQQRWQFTPALEREEEAILEIRNQATFAKPAASADRSRFARPLQELFEG